MSGDLDVDGNLTISGAGQAATIISASGLGDRIIQVLNNYTLNMDHLTLTGGHAPDGVAGSLGAQGTYGQYGGAILTGTTTSLVLSHVTIAQNRSGNGGDGGFGNPNGGGGGGGGYGGGVHVYSGTLTINDSEFSENFTGYGGSGGNGSAGTARLCGRVWRVCPLGWIWWCHCNWPWDPEHHQHEFCG